MTYAWGCTWNRIQMRKHISKILMVIKITYMIWCHIVLHLFLFCHYFIIIHIMSYCIVLHHTVWHHIVSYVWHHIISYHIVRCDKIWCNTMWYDMIFCRPEKRKKHGLFQIFWISTIKYILSVYRIHTAGSIGIKRF